MTIPSIFYSKKFWVLVGSVVTIILVDVLGMPPEQVDAIQRIVAALGGTYIVAQGFADGMSKGVTSSEARHKAK